MRGRGARLNPAHPPVRWRAWASIGLVVAGLALWAHGLAPTAADEWLAQAAWTAAWLVCIERVYGALLAVATTTGARAHPALGAVRSPRDAFLLVALGAAMAPLSVVVETCTQCLANHLLYDPGDAVPTFFGWMRGLIDSRSAAAVLTTTAQPLSAFSRDVLGWRDEVNPFAVVLCAAMAGNAIWAAVATAIGTGAVRREAPIVARAFRLAGLQAATAPVFTLGYYLARGGDGLNVWSGVLRVLTGSFDAGGQVPTWVRVTGVALFFLLPPLVAAWRLHADRRALPVAPAPSAPRRHPVAGAPGGLAAPVLGAVVTGPLLCIWALELAGSPWTWSGQSMWLALWLAYLLAALRAIAALGADVSRPVPAWRVVAGAWPLAVAGLVVQVGVQWVAEGGHAVPRFFGWVVGEVVPAHGETRLAPVALAAAFLGNALWAATLLGLARRAWQDRRSTAAQTFGLGALQAATAPVALCALLVLSIITRDRAAPGVPRYDVWHVWTYLARAATGASFETEVVPTWLRLLAATLLIAMPIVGGAACVALERRGWRALARGAGRPREALDDGIVVSAAPPVPAARRAAG